MSIGHELELRLSNDAFKDLAHLAKHQEYLRQITDVVSNLPPGDNLTDAAVKVAREVAVSQEDAERLFHTFLNLHTLKERQEQSAKEFLSSVFENVRRRLAKSESDKVASAWEDAQPIIVEFLDSMTERHPFVLLRKAENLAFAHANVATEFRLLTDVRPVFSDAGDEIIESLVVHHLLVNYFDGERARRIEFALDADDVAELKRLCTRAEAKASVIDRQYKQAGWACVIPGVERSVGTVPDK